MNGLNQFFSNKTPQKEKKTIFEIGVNCYELQNENTKKIGLFKALDYTNYLVTIKYNDNNIANLALSFEHITFQL